MSTTTPTSGPSKHINDLEFAQLSVIPDASTWQVAAKSDTFCAWYREDPQGHVNIQVDATLPYLYDDVFRMMQNVQLRSNSDRCERAQVVEQVSAYAILQVFII